MANLQAILRSQCAIALDRPQDVLRAVNQELKHHFGISHSTIQVEVEGCDPDDMYCIVRAIGNGRMLQHRH